MDGTGSCVRFNILPGGRYYTCWYNFLTGTVTGHRFGSKIVVQVYYTEGNNTVAKPKLKILMKNNRKKSLQKPKTHFFILLLHYIM